MGRTWLRQEVQVYKSLTYASTNTPGSTMESNAVSVEDDLNNIRSILKRHLAHSDSANWYDDNPDITVRGVTTTRGLKQIHQHVAELEQHLLLYRNQILTDVTVPSSQNWVVLSVAGGAAPTLTASVTIATALGAVVAVLGDGEIGSHKLTAVSGFNALNPYNLAIVREGDTGDPILSGDRIVYALLQAQFGTVDGDAFDDSTKKVQLSFVRSNAAGDALEACPVADIQGQKINYSYISQVNFDDLPKHATLVGAFVDQSATVDVTLNNAIDNQSGAATQDQNIEWRITDDYTLEFQNSDGSVSFLTFAPAAAGDTVSFESDDLTFITTNDINMSNGLIVDSAGTAINIGVTAAQIDAAADLTIAATGSGSDLTLSAADLLIVSDGYKAGSTFSSDLSLSASSAEWDAYETAFGEVSLLSAIVQATQAGGHDKKYAVVTGTITKDTNVTGAGGSPNIDAQLFDYSGLDFMTDVNIYLNGQLLRPGADAAADHDVYPGTNTATGDLKFEFVLRVNDVITMEIFSKGL